MALCAEFAPPQGGAFFVLSPLPGTARFKMRSALLCASSAERIFIISRLSHSAECDRRFFSQGRLDTNPLSHLALLDASSPEGGAFVCCRKAVPQHKAGSPSQALTRQIPLFVTCGDIFPRSGGSLSSKGKPLAKPETLPYCQGLSLWERWHRAAMTERASPFPAWLQSLRI